MDTTVGDYGDDLNVELSDAADRAAADLKFSNDVELANQSTDWLKGIGVNGDYGSDTGVGSAGTSYTFDPSVLSNLSFSKVNDYLKGNRGLASLIGGAGLAALGAGTPTTKSSIYQGGIPNLVATRNMITAPPTGRRAGAGGVNYGGDVTYSLAPAGQKPYSLTRGDSAFITDPQGQANVLKGTGGADTQSMANKIGYNLPGGWDSFTPQQKIEWFNRNNVSYDQLRAAGVPQSDIDYMWSNGYASGRPANWGKTTPVTGGAGTVTGGADTVTGGASTVTGGAGIDSLVDSQNKAQTQADKVGLQLPSDWSTYNAAQKIAWYNTNNITEAQLLAAGVDQATINWMKQNGYGSSNKTSVDTVTGGTGADTISSGAGADTISSGAGSDSITGGAGSDSITGGSGIDALVAAQNKAQTQADTIGLKLPSDWSTYDAAQKIAWYNSNNITPAQLLAAGVDQGTIDWMKSNGYGPQVSTPIQSEGLKSALTQGMTEEKYIDNIKDWLTQNADASDTAVRAQMDSFGISPADVAKALDQDVNKIQDKYNNAFTQGTAQQKADAYNMLLDEGLTDAQIRASIEKSAGKQADEDWSYLQNLAKPKEVPPQAPTQSAGLQSAIQQGMTEDQYIGNIRNWLTQNATASDAEVFKQMQEYGIGAEDVARALGVPISVIQSKIDALGGNNYAQGGMAQGRYLQGGTDGMADEIPAQIGEDQPAALSHGEFVIPADVVSHMGNGNSDAGAKKLYEMMDRIRMARTGTKEQGRKINPDKFMPGGLAKAYAGGGSVKNFATGGTATLPVNVTGQQAGLSSWAGDYTTDLMGQGRALANMPYQAYMGPLTAGPSALQNKVTQGLESLDFPGTLGKSFTSAGAPAIGADGQPVGGGGIASSYMNPYLKNVLDPQLEELRRQSQINLQPSLAKLTQSGGFGGGRQAIMESEAGRNLLNAQNTAIGTGYANAYDKAMQQFNVEQGQAKTLADMMASQGATERAIEAEGVAADKAQFEEARANPFKMVQFQQSLLSGMPINASDYTVQDPSTLTKVAQGVNTVDELLKVLYGITPAKKV